MKRFFTLLVLVVVAQGALAEGIVDKAGAGMKKGAEATEHGLKVDVMPSEYTISGLVEAIRAHFENEGS